MFSDKVARLGKFYQRNLVAVLRADGVKFYIPMQACDT
jgi:hypothetical protein